MTPKIVFIGHIAIDTVFKLGKKTDPSLGGSVSYCSISLREYNQDVEIGIISTFNESLYKDSILLPLRKNDIDLKGLKLVEDKPTRFVLKYINHSRKLKLKSRCPDLKFDDIPSSFFEDPPGAVCFVPICNEIPYSLVKKIKEKLPNIYYGIDVQGFIRKINRRGKIKLTRDENLIDELKRIIELLGNHLIIKGSEEEMKLISGRQEWDGIMEYFKQFDCISIMTLGEKGSLIAKKDKNIITIPAFQPCCVIDETGAGDVYLSILLYEFLNSNKSWDAIRDAAYFASSAASFEVERKGVNGFQSLSKVQERINEGNVIKRSN
ncbi:MAG: putative sugar kinase [Promethearchaeota archaeon]|nr:MAG: putative sugar kinase [Candidatus Lokiarchaeota archaeon]